MLTRLTNEQQSELEAIAELLADWNRMNLRSDDPRKPEIFQIVADLQRFALNLPLHI